MKNNFLINLAACALFVVFTPKTSTLQAQNKSTTIPIKMNTVTNNCGSKAPDVKADSLTLVEEENKIRLTIEGLPTIGGDKNPKGKLRLTAKNSSARYSANGRRKEDALRLVLIIEHFAGNKPTCTQSFSIHNS